MIDLFRHRSPKRHQSCRRANCLHLRAIVLKATQQLAISLGPMHLTWTIGMRIECQSSRQTADTGDSTIAAVRVGFARKAIDGSALTRLGQQELSQSFGQPSGQAFSSISSELSNASASSIRSQSEPSDREPCVETEASFTSSIVISDADVNLQAELPAAAIADDDYIFRLTALSLSLHLPTQ